jgi:hypothetical protein
MVFIELNILPGFYSGVTVLSFCFQRNNETIKAALLNLTCIFAQQIVKEIHVTDVEVPAYFQ